MSRKPESFFLASSMNFLGPPPSRWMLSSISRTSWLAPPCSGPHRAQMPAATLAKTLAWALPTIRTVEVEQFCS